MVETCAHCGAPPLHLHEADCPVPDQLRREYEAAQPKPRISVKPIFAWYDIWVGAFWDQAKRRLYVFPVPMFGVVIQFPVKP